MKKFFNVRPVVFSAISLILGILTTYFSLENDRPLPLFIAVGVIFSVCAVWLLVEKSRRALIISLALLCAFSVGTFSVTHKISKLSSNLEFDGETVEIVATVKSVTNIGKGNAELLLSRIDCAECDIGVNAVCKVGDSSIKRGDRVKISGKLNYLDVFDDISVLTDGAPLEIEVESFSVVLNDSTVFTKIFNAVKTKIVNNFDDNNEGIALALLTGDTSLMDESVLTTFRLAGVAHVFAVSGLHVTFFAFLLSFVLELLRIKRWQATVVTTLLSITYAGVCGFPYSALRSVIMTTVLNLCRSFGKKYDALNSICFSMIIILLIFPESVFSYGFILSYLAVLGIALWSKPFEKLFSFMPEKLGQAFAVSLASTLALTPAFLKMWGYMSIITVFLNVLIIPLVSVLYGIIFVTLLLTSIIPINFLFFVPNALTYFISSFMTVIDHERFLLFATPTVVGLVLYYSFALSFTGRFNFNKQHKIYGAVLTVATFALMLGGAL